MIKSAKSFLEFGAIDSETDERMIWDFRTGQQAYDWFMAARYLNDLICYREMTKACREGHIEDVGPAYREQIHHPDDASVNLNKLFGLMSVAALPESAKRPIRFLELGSTILGCIEGMEFCHALLGHYGLVEKDWPLGEVTWHGIENSKMLNRLVDFVYPQSQISTFVDYPDPFTGYDVFFAKGVSLLYKVETAVELARVLASAKISIFDYSFSLKGNRRKIIGSGKTVHYLDVGDAREALKSAGGTFVVRTGETRVEPERERVFVNGLYGNPEVIRKFIDIDERLRRGLIEGCRDDTFSDLMLAGIEGGKESWLPFDEFCDARLGS